MPVLADDDRLHDLLQLLDLPIDLGRADAHAAGIQHRVRAPIDDEAAVLRDLAPVAVAPHAGKALVIRRAVFRAVLVVPEAERHRRKRRRAHELALLAGCKRMPPVVEHLDPHPHEPALELPAPHGNDRAAAGEARDWDVFLINLAETCQRKNNRRRAGLDFLTGYALSRRTAARIHAVVPV